MMEINLFLIMKEEVYFIIVFKVLLSSNISGYDRTVEQNTIFFQFYFDCCRFFLANIILSWVYFPLVMMLVTGLIDSAAYPLIGLDAL